MNQERHNVSTDTATQTQTTTPLANLRNQPVAAQAAPVMLGFFDLAGFELTQRVSKAFASSDLVPKQYQGNLSNCMIALDMAQRMNANPLMVMQNLYIVHGTPGWSAKFLIATINVCGRFTSLRYEWRGQPGALDFGCRAWAVEKATGERLDGIWVDWKMVKAEGWDSKNGSKWKTMPDQMFIYRAATFWQRGYAPELGMGLQTAEELQDTIDAIPSRDGRIEVDVDQLRNTQATESKAKPAGKAKPADVSDAELKTANNTDKPAAAETQSEVADPQFDTIAAKLTSAPDVEHLDLAADFIREVGDAASVAKLEEIYRVRRVAFEGGGDEQPAETQKTTQATTRSARTRATPLE